MKTYKSTTGLIIQLILFLVIGLDAFLITKLLLSFNLNSIVPIVILSLTSIFLLWIFLKTEYQISESVLHYQSGPINGKIDINSIKKIKTNTTKWVGLKPALDTKGLIVTYNKYDDIYISPERQNEFIEALKAKNPNIKIIEG